MIRSISLAELTRLCVGYALPDYSELHSIAFSCDVELYDTFRKVVGEPIGYWPHYPGCWYGLEEDVAFSEWLRLDCQNHIAKWMSGSVFVGNNAGVFVSCRLCEDLLEQAFPFSENSYHAHAVQWMLDDSRIEWCGIPLGENSEVLLFLTRYEVMVEHFHEVLAEDKDTSCDHS